MQVCVGNAGPEHSGVQNKEAESVLQILEKLSRALCPDGVQRLRSGPQDVTGRSSPAAVVWTSGGARIG